MSAKHPIIAVTGSSGAGTTTTSEAFRKMFNMMNVKPAWLKAIASIALLAQKWTSKSAKPASKVDTLATLAHKLMTSRD